MPINKHYHLVLIKKNILSLFKNQVFLFDRVAVMFSGEYQNQKTQWIIHRCTHFFLVVKHHISRMKGCRSIWWSKAKKGQSRHVARPKGHHASDPTLLDDLLWICLAKGPSGKECTTWILDYSWGVQRGCAVISVHKKIILGSSVPLIVLGAPTAGDLQPGVGRTL